jgi:hypothetical protein
VTTIKPIAVYRRDAAAMLGVSPSQVDRLRHRGVLRAIQLEPGTDFMYAVSELEALVASRDGGRGVDAAS